MVRPIVILACAFITAGFYFCRKMYVHRSRELKRIEAAGKHYFAVLENKTVLNISARSPLNTTITSTVHGLSTIRAYRKENEMIEKFCALHVSFEYILFYKVQF